MSLKEDAKVFFAALLLVACQRHQRQIAASIQPAHIYSSHIHPKSPSLLPFHSAFTRQEPKLHECDPSSDVDCPTRPHPAPAAGSQISYLFRRKGWIELAGCKEGAIVASPHQNPLHTLLCHLERMPVAVFRSVNWEPCQFKGILSQPGLSVWRVRLIEREIVFFGHSEHFTALCRKRNRHI